MSNGKPNWTVDDALDEVVAAIEEGNGPLTLAADARTGLRSFYRKSFEDMHAAGEDWNVAKKNVLLLSNAVGALAAVIEIYTSFPKPPGRISSKNALAAAEAIAYSKICDPSRPKKTGGWCTGSVPLREASSELRGMAQALSRFLGGPDQQGKRGAAKRAGKGAAGKGGVAKRPAAKGAGKAATAKGAPAAGAAAKKQARKGGGAKGPGRKK
ncbi:MAG TPA: hypothetical protein VMT16_01345 [Thermoanaerobaculia bacterium]|nr:hypothetical protein [Thermoanaerobaculia bacterium]